VPDPDPCPDPCRAVGIKVKVDPCPVNFAGSRQKNGLCCTSKTNYRAAYFGHTLAFAYIHAYVLLRKHDFSLTHKYAAQARTKGRLLLLAAHVNVLVIFQS
jgi:hypothetical protein